MKHFYDLHFHCFLNNGLRHASCAVKSGSQWQVGNTALLVGFLYFYHTGSTGTMQGSLLLSTCSSTRSVSSSTRSTRSSSTRSSSSTRGCTHKVKNELHVVGCRVEKSKPIVKSRIGCATINIRNTQREQSHDKVYLYGQNSANNPNRTHNYVSGGKISLFEPEIIHHFTQKAYNPTAGIILYQSTTKNQQRKRKEEVEPASSTKCPFLWLGGGRIARVVYYR